MKENYRKLMQDVPEYFIGTAEETPIRILTDCEDISKLEQELETEIGIVYEDKYIYLLRDGVVFPNGVRGTYIRLLPKNVGSAAAVLVLVDGKILLMSHYRHSLRKHMWEIPRGFGEKGLTAEENVQKEMKEEIGLEGGKVQFLGHVCPDSGLQCSQVSVYAVEFSGEQKFMKNDEEEAIDEYWLASVEEVKELVQKGELEDGFTLSALALAMMKGMV